MAYNNVDVEGILRLSEDLEGNSSLHVVLMHGNEGYADAACRQSLNPLAKRMRPPSDRFARLPDGVVLLLQRWIALQKLAVSSVDGVRQKYGDAKQQQQESDGWPTRGGGEGGGDGRGLGASRHSRDRDRDGDGDVDLGSDESDGFGNDTSNVVPGGRRRQEHGPSRNLGNKAGDKRDDFEFSIPSPTSIRGKEVRGAWSLNDWVQGEDEVEDGSRVGSRGIGGGGGGGGDEYGVGGARVQAEELRRWAWTAGGQRITDPTRPHKVETARRDGRDWDLQTAPTSENR